MTDERDRPRRMRRDELQALVSKASVSTLDIEGGLQRAASLAQNEELAQTNSLLVQLISEIKETNRLLNEWVLPAGINGLAAEIGALEAILASLQNLSRKT